jgi:predicted phage terminase large subunit-like protein
MLVIDPAATCNKDSDYTALAIGGKDKDKNLYILDVRLFKLPPDKWIREMYKLLDKWHLKSIYLETISFAAILKDTMRRYFTEFYPISIRDYKPTQKSSKKERIESGLEPLMTNSMLYMTTWCKSNTELVDQFNFFPAETVHDDGVDAVQMLNEVCKPTLQMSDKQKTITKHTNAKYGGSY